MIRYAIFNDTEWDAGHYGCGLVMRNLVRLIEENGGAVVFRWPFNRAWSEEEILPLLKEVDAVIVNGEGTLHHSSRKPNVMALAGLAGFVRDQLGIPAFLVNAGLYQNDARFYELLQDFDRVFVRDKLSEQEASRHGVACQVVPDLTLSLEDRGLQPVRQGVGVTDSVKEKITSRLRRLARRDSCEFRPMALTRPIVPNLLQRFSTSSVRRWVRATLRERRYGPDSRFDDPADFVEWLKGKEFVVTGRYHTVTLCLLTATPFKYLESSTPKISSLLGDVWADDDRWRISHVPRHIDADWKRSMTFSDGEKQRLDQFLAFSRERNAAMIGEIMKRVRSSA